MSLSMAYVKRALENAKLKMPHHFSGIFNFKFFTERN